ncbi:MAG: TraG/TraD family protein, partial [Rhodospirillales bacterium]
ARESQSRSGDAERTVRMSRPEALSTLGLVEPVTTAEINAAYKRLISKVHPDVGGNAFLASRVNEARDVLLKKTA